MLSLSLLSLPFGLRIRCVAPASRTPESAVIFPDASIRVKVSRATGADVKFVSSIHSSFPVLGDEKRPVIRSVAAMGVSGVASPAIGATGGSLTDDSELIVSSSVVMTSGTTGSTTGAAAVDSTMVGEASTATGFAGSAICATASGAKGSETTGVDGAVACGAVSVTIASGAVISGGVTGEETVTCETLADADSVNHAPDEKSRFMVAKVVDDPKFGVPGSMRESTVAPVESRSAMFKLVFGILTAVVTRFGFATSVVFGSVIE